MFQKSKEKDDLDILARRSTDKLGDISTRISPEVRIKGEILGKNNVKLEGGFEGDANIQGLFLVGNTGKFKGEMSADQVVIEGDFEGNVKAAKKLELRSSAKFRGNIVANVVAIAEGCFFEGEIKMGSEGKSAQFAFEEKRKIKTNSDID